MELQKLKLNSKNIKQKGKKGHLTAGGLKLALLNYNYYYYYSQVYQYPTAADSTLPSGKRKALIEEIEPGESERRIEISSLLIQLLLI